MKTSSRELEFSRLWKLLGSGIAPIREFRFDLPRLWRFDFAWVDQKLAIEIDGGTRGRPVVCHRCGVRVRARTAGGVGKELRLGGGHNRGAAFQRSIDKQNSAVALGWRVLRFTEADLTSKPVQCVELVKRLLKATKIKG